MRCNYGVSTMIGLMLATTINVIPLVRSSPPVLPTPPPVGDSAAVCKSVEPLASSAVGVALIGHVDTASTTAYFVGLATMFSVSGDMKLKSSGFLYLRLDGGPQQFIAIRPSGHDSGTDILVAFQGLREGAHFIEFALTSTNAQSLPYGRICFDVHLGKNTRFQFVNI
jgi:hypothetical protein